MNPKFYEKIWIPYTIAVIGILLSLVLWYRVREDLIASFAATPPVMESYHPWLVLSLGIIISILIASIIRLSQLAQKRADILEQTNHYLKNEIKERMAAEETKQKLEVALLQGQKLQAIGTLAGGIAHDFNNLLYAIIGYVEMARDDADKQSLIYTNLGKVLEATQRGQDLVARILAFSRRQHQDYDRIEVRQTIGAVLELLRPTIPASAHIIFNPSADFTIIGNQTQIHQVLVNIINNAVDAMDGEGTINIQINQISSDDDLVKQLPKPHSKNYCKIEISDTGHGMDQVTMERIFEPFFTTKEVGKGTGLGLSIVHTIVKEHQGDIIVQSQLGKGTKFIILLPEIE